MDLFWLWAVIPGPSAKEAATTVRIEVTTFRVGMDPEIEILTGIASVIAAPATLSGVILIAPGPGSNPDSITVIAIARPIATSQNFTGGIIIVRHTGTGLNFGPGVIGRFTGMVVPDDSTDDRTIPW